MLEQESAWAAHPVASLSAWEQESVWTLDAASQTADLMVRLPAWERESAWAVDPVARLAASEQEPVRALEQASEWAACPVARLPASEPESVRASGQAWAAYLRRSDFRRRSRSRHRRWTFDRLDLFLLLLNLRRSRLAGQGR